MPTILLRLLPYIAAVALLAGAYAVGHVKGTASCQVKDATKETTAIKKDGDNHDTIDFKDHQLSDPALDKRVDKFVRSS